MANDITKLLSAYNDGDASALDQLASQLYNELKFLARGRSRNSRDLSATTLVQETFLKLLASNKLKATDRQQFFALSATIMRQIVIDEIRYQHAAKREGLAVTFIDAISADNAIQNAEFLLQVDEALKILTTEDENLTRAFECRYFAGMSMTETAETLGVSVRSAERLWSKARGRMGELFDGV